MLTVFYTYNIRGDLDLLPRLYTYFKQLRGRGEPPVRPYDAGADRFLLLDLGNSCSPEVWHCAVTGGRSTLIVLDAMGYHAAHVSVDAGVREKLRDNLLGLRLVDDEHPWQDDDILVTSGRGETPVRPYMLHIVLSPAAETRLDGRRLSLGSVEAGQVGIVRLGDEPLLLDHTIQDMSPDTPPDPTITATVDFVLNEARAWQHKIQPRR